MELGLPKTIPYMVLRALIPQWHSNWTLWVCCHRCRDRVQCIAGYLGSPIPRPTSHVLGAQNTRLPENRTCELKSATRVCLAFMLPCFRRWSLQLCDLRSGVTPDVTPHAPQEMEDDAMARQSLTALRQDSVRRLCVPDAGPEIF